MAKLARQFAASTTAAFYGLGDGFKGAAFVLIGAQIYYIGTVGDAFKRVSTNEVFPGLKASFNVPDAILTFPNDSVTNHDYYIGFKGSQYVKVSETTSQAMLIAIAKGGFKGLPVGQPSNRDKHPDFGLVKDKSFNDHLPLILDVHVFTFNDTYWPMRSPLGYKKFLRRSCILTAPSAILSSDFLSSLN